MDIDAFTAVHAPEWDRAEELLRQRRLTGAESDELVRSYQRIGTQLSLLRSAAPDPALISRLSRTLAQARARIAGTHDPGLSDLARFFRVVLPVALYRIRWWALAVTGGCLLVAVIAGWWVASSPGALAAMGTPMEREHYVKEAFAAYYSDNPAPSFAAQVWTNNAWIAAQCIGGGITGLYPLYVLFTNSVSVGATGGMMIHHGAGQVFFGLITPHGLLELSAVFVAGAAGLRLFWAWVAPGPLPRGKAIARAGRETFTVVVALVIALAVSGLLEAFVTPSQLPAAVKIGLGLLACAALWACIWIPGRFVLAAGHDADLREGEREDEVAYSG